MQGNDVVRISPELIATYASDLADLAGEAVTITSDILNQYVQIGNALQGKAGSKFGEVYNEIAPNISDIGNHIALTANYLYAVASNYSQADVSYEGISHDDYNWAVQFMKETMRRSMPPQNPDQEPRGPGAAR